MARVRDAEGTRTAILDAAFETIYQNGFHATSVDEIVAKTNLTKGAFFHHFPTKNDLGYALADEVLKDMMLARWIRPLAGYKNPVQGMVVRLRRNMEDATDEVIAFGCPLNNLTQEMSSVDPVFRDKLRDVLETWIDETRKQLKRAQTEGYLKPNVDVRQVAEFVVMMEEGYAALGKNLRDRRVYWSVYEGFRQYMDSISAQPKKSSTGHAGTRAIPAPESR
jgi:TetR/AcrR family transcriptional regulator, transcriptional repressor for nem operon